MRSMKIKGVEEDWANLPIATSGKSCTPGLNRYCLGKYRFEDGSTPGFLGKWKKALTSSRGSKVWGEVRGTQSPLVEEIWAGPKDEITWMNFLTCVMYQALKIQKVKAKTKERFIPIWDKNHWPAESPDSASEDWSLTSEGQAILVSLTCIIKALIGWQRLDQPPTGQVKELCQAVWDTIGLDLGNRKTGEPNNPLENLGGFLQALEPAEGDQRDNYLRLGFLLSIYYGLINCGKYEGNYDLTSFITNGEQELDRIGACELEGGVLNCEGGTGTSKAPRLTIWRKENRTVVMPTSQENVSRLTLTETETGTPLAVGSPETRPPSQLTPELAGWVHTTTEQHNRSSTAAVWVPGQPSSKQEAAQKLSEKSRQLRQVAESPGPHNNSRATPRGPEQDRVSRPSPPPQLPSKPAQRTGRVTETLTPVTGTLTSTEPAEEEITGQSSTGTHHVETTDTLQGENMGQLPTEEDKSTRVGSIAGGVLGALLMIASLYGLKRVYWRRRRGPGTAGPALLGTADAIRYGPTTSD
ncbi:hypothetical protein C922_05680 [Plasmodium inui San Antonio 1]|uniref:Uncharacterized protein n=1 Tax=Plasmodium inui San Antonio 1 TaxID=1237626 RepID=W7AF75_9APIC|nr:hypothetical protein C922_05680 [Plasmodium inui San Antonio 1]EUD63941.1 hypothetical protein C922_05680 [Plasmodium inui San Antonio 1]